MNAKTFVVPLDGSEFAERALPVADKLAERIGGNLLLVSAQYYGPVEPRAYLDEQAVLRRSPVEVIATKDAYAAEIISETVEGTDDRVVCMTTHGRGRLRWAALGQLAGKSKRSTHSAVYHAPRCHPICTSQGQTSSRGASIVIACVVTAIGRRVTSSPGSARRRSARVAP